MTGQTTRGHRPDIQPSSGAGRRVQSERSESRSDASGALDAVGSAPTLEGRGDPHHRGSGSLAASEPFDSLPLASVELRPASLVACSRGASISTRRRAAVAG